MHSPLPYIITFSMICTPLNAQTADDAETQPKVPVVTLSDKTMTAIAQDPRAFVEKAINSMFHATSSGVITKDVIATLKQMDLARIRSGKLNEILIFDLDGSFSIEPEEIALQNPHLDTRLRTGLGTYMAMADIDRDGTLSTEEIKEFVGTPLNSRERRNSRRISVAELMQFDANCDGQVTPTEIGEVVAQLVESGDVHQRK